MLPVTKITPELLKYVVDEFNKIKQKQKRGNCSFANPETALQIEYTLAKLNEELGKPSLGYQDAKELVPKIMEETIEQCKKVRHELNIEALNSIDFEDQDRETFNKKLDDISKNIEKKIIKFLKGEKSWIGGGLSLNDEEGRKNFIAYLKALRNLPGFEIKASLLFYKAMDELKASNSIYYKSSYDNLEFVERESQPFARYVERRIVSMEDVGECLKLVNQIATNGYERIEGQIQVINKFFDTRGQARLESVAISLDNELTEIGSDSDQDKLESLLREITRGYLISVSNNESLKDLNNLFKFSLKVKKEVDDFKEAIKSGNEDIVCLLESVNAQIVSSLGSFDKKELLKILNGSRHTLGNIAAEAAKGNPDALNAIAPILGGFNTKDLLEILNNSPLALGNIAKAADKGNPDALNAIIPMLINIRIYHSKELVEILKDSPHKRLFQRLFQQLERQQQRLKRIASEAAKSNPSAPATMGNPVQGQGKGSLRRSSPWGEGGGEDSAAKRQRTGSRTGSEPG